MIKRPISAGAVILAVILYVAGFLGVSDRIPQSFPKEGSRIGVLGLVETREKTAYGMRICLKECEVFPNLSKKISDFNFLKNSDVSIKKNPIKKKF